MAAVAGTQERPAKADDLCAKPRPPWTRPNAESCWVRIKVSPKASKKQILLDFFRARGKRRIEVGDLHAARNELRRHLGPGDRTSLGYIASILREAGYEVRYEDRYSDPVMPEPYATRLKGVLEFHDLASAEQSLLRARCDLSASIPALRIALARRWSARS